MQLLPRCRKCNNGDLVPLSDEGRSGGHIQYKAWICSNPECSFSIVFKSGDIFKDMSPMKKGQ